MTDRYTSFANSGPGRTIVQPPRSATARPDCAATVRAIPLVTAPSWWAARAGSPSRCATMLDCRGRVQVFGEAPPDEPGSPGWCTTRPG